VPRTAKFDFEAILRALANHEVDFILVGGIAALLEGADINITLTLEILHSGGPANIARLLAALDSLQATYRTRPELALKPDASHLASPGHQLLMTRHGPLDVLGTIGRSRSYEDLLPHTHEVEAAEGLRVRVLDLETLIAIKEEVGGEKDLAVLPIMRRTLEEKRRQ
jgi:hypothetical protein